MLLRPCSALRQCHTLRSRLSLPVGHAHADGGICEALCCTQDRVPCSEQASLVVKGCLS